MEQQNQASHEPLLPARTPPKRAGFNSYADDGAVGVEVSRSAPVTPRVMSVERTCPGFRKASHPWPSKGQSIRKFDFTVDSNMYLWKKMPARTTAHGGLVSNLVDKVSMGINGDFDTSNVQGPQTRRSRGFACSRANASVTLNSIVRPRLSRYSSHLNSRSNVERKHQEAVLRQLSIGPCCFQALSSFTFALWRVLNQVW